MKINSQLMPQKDPDKAVMVRISVTDTGIGIAADNLPKLFNPFERFEAERSGTEGTGLGLAVVKKLVDAMGGTLGVESTPGEGSTFWFELPFCESQLEKIEKTGQMSDMENNQTGKTGTILYIEDNSSNVELVEQILLLQRENIHIITNTFGKEALNLALTHQPDLILLDLNLPDIHGSEVLEILKANETTKSIPVVIISADAMPQQLEKLLRSGAENYLTKPLNVVDLLQVIDEFVS